HVGPGDRVRVAPGDGHRGGRNGNAVGRCGRLGFGECVGVGVGVREPGGQRFSAGDGQPGGE
ncbi:hypothetical protein, partial [Actinacidiphila soli]|uniref:hypothetical protein n=1 Tax=Actinacidiphila soli TaxID=2487275 RepID=UPI0013E3617B